MVDLSTFEKRINRYGGSEDKDTYYKNGKYYLVKKPDAVRQKGNSLSYMNNVFAEHISCRIFNVLGISAQKTELAVLNENGKNKVVCVCEDFTDENHSLVEFGKQFRSNEVTRNKNAKSKELNIYKIVDSIAVNEHIYDTEQAINQFWKTFVVDALICNKDRHNENWGYLENKKTGETVLAPVYDCGSSLFPLISENSALEHINSGEYKNLVVNCPSAMNDGYGRIFYRQFLQSLSDNGCTKALCEIFPKIDLDNIGNIIDDTEFLSPIHKACFMHVVELSYNYVLKPAYKAAIKRENERCEAMRLQEECVIEENNGNGRGR